MAVRPTIEVTQESVNTIERTPGMAGRIAVIGAFDSEVTDITLVSDDTTAHSIFGTSTTPGTFKGTDTIDYLFIGASELLVANITTWTTAEPPVAETTLTNAKLTAALAKLKNETFDLLFIAEELTDEAQTIVTTWLNNEFKHKFAHSQVIQLQKSTASAYETSVATIGNQVAYILTQTLKYYGTQLNLNQSAALMAGLIAGKRVNESLTSSILIGVTGCTPEYTTETGDIGAKLMELNVPIVECRNRRLNQFICVNSMLPNGLDMYINRTRDYIINTLEAEILLGKTSSDITLDGAQMIVEKVRKECVDDLQLLEDIQYTITKVNSTTVEIALTKLIFNGVITKVKVKYSIEVQ